MSDNNDRKRLRWAQAARRHHIGRASARHVIQTVEPTPRTTVGGANAWLWLGPDERGRELEIIAVEIDPGNGDHYLLVIHVMPTGLRRR
jgi:hypothetical protein